MLPCVNKAIMTCGSQVVKWDALDATSSHLCHDLSGDALNYVGTATVARDLERLSSVLEGPDTPVCVCIWAIFVYLY